MRPAWCRGGWALGRRRKPGQQVLAVDLGHRLRDPPVPWVQGCVCVGTEVTLPWPWFSDAHGRTAEWAVPRRALQPQLVFSVGQRGVPACLFGGKGSALARKFLPKSVPPQEGLVG